MLEVDNSQKISYDKIDPEEIIIKLKEILAFLQRKQLESK